MRPNYEQYKFLIESCDDGVRNTIILYKNGLFGTVENFNVSKFTTDYVGRGETLQAGNGYVGKNAVNDELYMNSSYAMYLKAWIEYIQNGLCKRYLDYYPNDSVEELEQIIELLEF